MCYILCIYKFLNKITIKIYMYFVNQKLNMQIINIHVHINI